MSEVKIRGKVVNRFGLRESEDSPGGKKSIVERKWRKDKGCIVEHEIARAHSQMQARKIVVALNRGGLVKTLR